MKTCQSLFSSRQFYVYEYTTTVIVNCCEPISSIEAVASSVKGKPLTIIIGMFFFLQISQSLMKRNYCASRCFRRPSFIQKSLHNHFDRIFLQGYLLLLNGDGEACRSVPGEYFFPTNVHLFLPSGKVTKGRVGVEWSFLSLTSITH